MPSLKFPPLKFCALLCGCFAANVAAQTIPIATSSISTMAIPPGVTSAPLVVNLRNQISATPD
ncbi:MAG: hypothetical protein WA324_07150, partial [Bryobacteraceae bacterium]